MTIEELIHTSEMPLSRKLTINLMLTAKWAEQQLNDTLKEEELSLQQFNVLRILRGQKGKPANLSTINERMVSKMSNTTRLIDKLILKGFVDRSACPSNRRKVEINITQKGLGILHTLDPIINGVENKIIANLEIHKLEQLNEMLNQLRK